MRAQWGLVRAMGGRICDLPPQYLDALATALEARVQLRRRRAEYQRRYRAHVKSQT